MSATMERPPPPPPEPARPTAERNGMGTAALVVGVVAVVLVVLLLFFPLAFVLGILAVIFGAVGMRRAKRGEATNNGQALAGLICGILAIVFSLYLGFRLWSFVADHNGDFRRFWTCITSAPTEEEQRQCVVTLARQIEDEGLLD